ncbi:MAG: HAMP domain-containing protein [Holophagales bacterium]|jgi:HAMP domain-containing protein|nr:HAMP domain-containing protein [Holophagales bacterium]MBK9965021.1 HAMP domain-containing protein [Holophagales bacterium]
MSLRARIQVLLGFLVGMPLLLLLFESYRAGRTAFLVVTRQESVQIARLEAAGIDLTFMPPRLVADGLALSVETCGSLREEEVRELLRRTLFANPGLYGITVALTPGATPLGRFAPYVFRKGGKLAETTVSYDYTERDWFRRPVESGRRTWIRPYFGETGGALMVTYSAPIRREGRVVGVASVDLDLESFVSRLRSLRPGERGSLYLVSRSGQILAHPDRPAAVDADREAQLGLLASLLAKQGRDMAEMKDPVTRVRSWIVEEPIDSLSEANGGQGWSLVVSWPLRDRLAPLGGLARRMLVLYVFLGGAALLLLQRSFEQVVTRPLLRLAEQTRGYANGDFRRRPPDASDPPEIRELGLALENLGTVLESEKRREPGTPVPP